MTSGGLGIGGEGESEEGPPGDGGVSESKDLKVRNPSRVACVHSFMLTSVCVMTCAAERRESFRKEEVTKDVKCN